MGKTAFLFPGQGAQKVGMGKEFYEQIPASAAIYDQAGTISGIDVKALCFEENDQLNQTEFTQIAIYTTSAAILAAVTEKGIRPDVCAGLSLGEYAALTACGTLDFADGAEIVRKRGMFMQQAVPSGGAMAAVLGADAVVIGKICDETAGNVTIANYNCPGQIVISGEKEAVDTACLRLKEAGAKRILPLNVSGPFHSPMLAGAGEQLQAVLEPIGLKDLTIPYVSNVTAGYVTDKEEIKDLLKAQVSAPVKWQQSVKTMIAAGVDCFIEIGPGKTLSGFIRKIDRNVQVQSINTIADLDQLEV